MRCLQLYLQMSVRAANRNVKLTVRSAKLKLQPCVRNLKLKSGVRKLKLQPRVRANHAVEHAALVARLAKDAEDALVTVGEPCDLVTDINWR